MNKQSIFFYLFLFPCLWIVSVSQSSGQEKNTATTLEQKADQLFAKWDREDSPGLAVALLKEGRIVYQKAFGSANLEYGIPNDLNTPFHVASLSKQFTAFAILLLQQDGRLSLDDDVRKYLQEVPDFGHTITLRHLATHTSGLRDQWRLMQLAGWRSGDVHQMEDVLKLVEQQKALNFIPGKQVMYCNTGFTLLAEVVARVSGKSFAAFTEERIFRPLQMHHSFFYDDHTEIVKNRAYSYDKEGAKNVKGILSFSIVGPTSLFSTTGDLCKWILNFTSPSVGGQTLIDEMNTLMVLNDGSVSEAGLGQFGGPKYAGMEWWDHTGSDAGYRAYLSRFPESKSGVVLLANVADVEASNKSLQLVALYLNEYFEKKENNAARKVVNVDPVSVIKLPRKTLEKYIGKYWQVEESYPRRIKLAKDTLIYFRSEYSQTKLVPVKENEFKMLRDGSDVSVVFEENEKGKNRMVVIIDGDRRVEFCAFESVEIPACQGKYYSEELETAYTLKIQNGKLVFQHLKKKDIPLNPIKKDLYTSANRNFKQINFQRNKTGEIIGFLLSNDGVKNMRFTKL